jgi:hypothetical protein
LLQEGVKQLIPVVITGISLVGFVGFAGAVIVWTRFSAAKVPADQAVAALPQDELVAIGSSLLLLFGFFGALAVLAVLLIDRGGRATPGMSRGLLLLLMVEGIVAIVAADGPLLEESIVAMELFLLPLAVVFWSTFATPFIRLDEDLPDRKGDEPEAELRDGPFLRVEGDLALSSEEIALTLAIPTNCAAAGVAAVLLGGGSPMTAALVGLAVLGAGLALMVGLHCHRFYRGKDRRAREKQGRHDREQRRQRELERQEELEERLLAEGDWREAAVLRRARRVRGASADADGEDTKPPRLELTGSGKVLMVVMMTGAVAAPALLFGKIWLAAALFSALILIAGLWRIADLAEARFMWYGLAVFISVPLFGTLMLMARNLDDPQVQPVALIRETDGPDEAIQGLYVTEAEDRVYFATVSTEGCSGELAPHSGRLLWVPKSEVVAMSIGPLQSVDDAARTSLEMAYALTPAVETPVGKRVSLTTPEQRSLAERLVGAEEDGRRLESVGAAVRPNFGAGWSLSPAAAAPGDVVTLRMSSPNAKGEIEGFGRLREGRSLRLGGVRVDVLKERARDPWTAEYVETSEGEALKLKKGTVYWSEDAPRESEEDATGNSDDTAKKELSFTEVDEPRPKGNLYLKLVDGSVTRVTTEEGSTVAEGSYLPLRNVMGSWLLAGDRESGNDEGDTRPLARTRDGETVRLELRLLRQAWHWNHIRFRVPENATSGAVTVECEQLAGQPLLRVNRPPEARIAVQMRAGSEHVVFDSRFSKDHDGKIASRRWTVDGIPRGHDRRVDEDLAPSNAPYTVRLTVTDAQHHSDSAEVRLLRLQPWQVSPPRGAEKSSGGTTAPLPGTGPQHLRSILAHAVVEEPDAELEMDLHVARLAAPPGSDLARAEKLGRKVNRQLLTEADLPDTIPSGGVPVRAMFYGDRCPPDLSEARRRIDIFVLGDGAQVLPPRGCRPGRVERTAW